MNLLDWNVLLVLFSVGVAGLTLWRMTIVFPFRMHRGWVAKAIFVLLLSGLLWLMAPQVAGIVSVTVTLVLITVPALLDRRATAYLARGEYQQLKRLTLMSRWLHPFDGWWVWPEIVEALILEQRGDVAAAAAILDQYTADRHHAVFVTTRLSRMRGHYADLVRWLESNMTDEDFRRDPGVLTTYIRALGEAGNPNKMLAIYDRFEKTLNKGEIFVDGNLLMTLAFCGERNEVARVLQHRSLRELPLVAHHFWLATADLTAGQTNRAREQFQVIQQQPDRIYARSAGFRLKQPPPVADGVLTPDSRTILEHVIQRLSPIDF